MKATHKLIFRNTQKCELDSSGIQNSWCKLQDFEAELKKDSPLEFTVIAAKKDGFESPFYNLLGFCTLKRDKAGVCSLEQLASKKVIEDLSSVYYQAYDIPKNIENDMRKEYERFHREMHGGVLPEVMPSVEATNVKKAA